MWCRCIFIGAFKNTSTYYLHKTNEHMISKVYEWPCFKNKKNASSKSSSSINLLFTHFLFFFRKALFKCFFPWCAPSSSHMLINLLWKIAVMRYHLLIVFQTLKNWKGLSAKLIHENEDGLWIYPIRYFHCRFILYPILKLIRHCNTR